MKKLIISLKTSCQVLDDFKTAFKKAKKGKLQDHFEISFDNRTDFNKFIKNLDILTFIIHHSPRSVYELAKLMERDVSNLNKIIFYYAVKRRDQTYHSAMILFHSFDKSMVFTNFCIWK